MLLSLTGSLHFLLSTILTTVVSCKISVLDICGNLILSERNDAPNYAVQNGMEKGSLVKLEEDRWACAATARRLEPIPRDAGIA